MTQPGYPDPNAQPQYGQSQHDQPQYGQQAGQYGQQGGGYPAAPAGLWTSPQNRPGMVTAAAVLAFISGGLGLLGSLLSFSLIGGLDVPGFFTVLLIIGLVLSVGMIFGGIQALQGKSFVILIVMAGISIVINLISMVTYFQAAALLSFVLPILILVFLMNPQAKAWIKAKGGQTIG